MLPHNQIYLLIGIKNVVAGGADVLLVPNVETGNSLVKMMIYFMGACAAGVVIGGKVPVVITLHFLYQTNLSFFQLSKQQHLLGYPSLHNLMFEVL